jgi:hypothetical protein
MQDRLILTSPSKNMDIGSLLLNHSAGKIVNLNFTNKARV